MTLATRVLNRLTLFVLALISLAVAATAAWPVVTRGAPMPLIAPLDDALRAAGLAPTTVAWSVAAAMAVVLVLALAIALTRPERHERAAVDTGGVAIDDTVVAALMGDALADVSDVLSVTAVTQRRRARRIVRMRVQVRPRTDLVHLQRRLADAVADTDRRLGIALPIVVLVTGGLRSALAHERRVA